MAINTGLNFSYSNPTYNQNYGYGYPQQGNQYSNYGLPTSYGMGGAGSSMTGGVNPSQLLKGWNMASSMSGGSIPSLSSLMGGGGAGGSSGGGLLSGLFGGGGSSVTGIVPSFTMGAEAAGAGAGASAAGAAGAGSSAAAGAGSSAAAGGLAALGSIPVVGWIAAALAAMAGSAADPESFGDLIPGIGPTGEAINAVANKGWDKGWEEIFDTDMIASVIPGMEAWPQLFGDESVDFLQPISDGLISLFGGG